MAMAMASHNTLIFSFLLLQDRITSRCGKLLKLVEEEEEEEEEESVEAALDQDYTTHGSEGGVKNPSGMAMLQLDSMPGGSRAFEAVAKFCYGAAMEMTPANVAALRCAAEYLDMSEAYGENNLIASTDSFLTRVVLTTWDASVQTLKSCEPLLPHAQDLSIVRRCVDSIARQAIVASEKPNMNPKKTFTSHRYTKTFEDKDCDQRCFPLRALLRVHQNTWKVLKSSVLISLWMESKSMEFVNIFKDIVAIIC